MSLLISKESHRCVTTQRGVLTVPVEDGLVRCHCVKGGSPRDCRGIDVRDLPLSARTLQQHFLAMGKRFVERLQVRGYEPASSSLWLHGPYPSLLLGDVVADVNATAWKEAQQLDRHYATRCSLGDEHPEYVLPYVHDLGANAGYVDYRFYGYFYYPEIVTKVTDLSPTDRSSHIITGVSSD